MDAQSEQQTTLRVQPTYLSMVDLKNDDYFKLVTVEIPQNFDSDVKPKLKVYKGTTLVSEQNLPGIPSNVQTLYVDDNQPKIPGANVSFLTVARDMFKLKFDLFFFFFILLKVIAVAIGSAVYFYKNVKPYFKYTFPSSPVDPLEREIWKKVMCMAYQIVLVSH